MAKKGAKAGRVGSDVKGAFGGALFLAGVAALIDESALGWAVAPFVLGLVFFAATRAPLRYSLAALACCAFILDSPNEQLATGMVQSPFYSVGFAMLAHLNNLTGIRALSFSGSDIVIGILIFVALSREKSGSKIDRADRMPTPKPLVKLAKISLMGTGFVFLFGQVTGGDFGKSLWQAERVIYLPTLFLLYHFALRGPQDYALLVKVVLGAATTRALMALYIKATVIPPVDTSTGLAVLAYCTSHSDSMLFAFAFVLLLLLIYERVGPKATKIALMLLPILMLGMIANNRRLVWVHVALILVTLYVVAPDNPVKRRIRRTLYTASPVLAIYAAAGWNSQYGSLFKPVRIMRSVVEPSTDGSSLWRELENFNLIYTLKTSPLFGQGYGHRWIEVVQLPAVEYDLEYYLPHNSLLGLWASAGLLGYTAMTLLWGAGVYFAMRAYHAATVPPDRVAAILCVGAVMVYMVQCFGDLGLGSWAGVHILAPSLAMAGKLAVSTGAWREPTSKA